jgi:hypothetical protein
MTNEPKLGDIFRWEWVSEYTKPHYREECAYFVLALTTKTKTPRVALFTINPQTMIDDVKWKFRRVFSRSQKVADFNNITQQEWKYICGYWDGRLDLNYEPDDPRERIHRLSEEDKIRVMEKFKDGKMVKDDGNFFHDFKFVPNNQ